VPVAPCLRSQVLSILHPALQLPAFILLYSTLLYSILTYPTLFYSILLYSTLLYSTLLYSILPYSTLLYPTLFYSTLLYSTLLYCISSSHNTPRFSSQVLHVRSISEWAPLCIGPYAQANVLADSLIYLAGQIPLDPSTMTVLVPSMRPKRDSPGHDEQGQEQDQDQGQEGILIPRSPRTSSASVLMDALQTQLCLSLRHAARVLEPLNSNLRRTLSCTVYVNIGVIQDTYGSSVFPLSALPADTGIGTVAVDGCGSSSNNMNSSSSKSSSSSSSSSSSNSNSSSISGSISGWSRWSEIAALAERLLVCNCQEPIAGKAIRRARSGDLGADGEKDSDTDSEDGTKGLRGSPLPLPVLVLGVRGIPRDCLIEVEIVAHSELLPASSFTADHREYHMSLPLPVTAGLDTTPDSSNSNGASETSETSTAAAPNARETSIAHTHTLSHGEDEGENEDDLDSDLWPIWHRDQTCNTNTNSLSGDFIQGSVTGTPPGSAPGAEVLSSRSISARQLVQDRGKCTTQPSSDVVRRPLYGVLTSAPCDSFDALRDGRTVLLANVRTVQSSRCVCSGFVSISLRLAASCPSEEPSVTDKNVLRNVLEAAADLLVLGVAQQMSSACMTVDALRTLRVYYQPDDSTSESRVRDALLLSCDRILQVAVPFILVPATHILRDQDASLPSLDTPLLSANFLLIDLLQVKSEIWIAGH
jgi:enamine deaminase RidA (YjgF/YER057c/UK114 family)